MNKNKYLLLVIICFIFLVGCSEIPISSIYNDSKKISSYSDSFSIEPDWQRVSITELKGTIKRMEGMDTIWTYDSSEDLDIDITYMFNVTHGKLKLVLICPDNSLETIIERNEDSDVVNSETSTLHLKKGTNRLKVIADDNASFEFNINIQKGKLKELGMQFQPRVKLYNE